MVILRMLRSGLVNRDFGLLLLAQLFASFGDYIFASSMTVWVASDLFTNSKWLPMLILLVLVATTLPRVLVGPFAGVWIDHMDARRVMILADGIRVAGFVLWAIAAIVLEDPVWLFVVGVGVVALNSVAAQFFDPARAVVVQIVLPPDRRVDGASRSILTVTGSAAAATALGPVLFAALGIGSAVVAGIVFFSFSMLLSISLRYRGSDSSALDRLSYWSDFGRGIKLAWRSPQLRMVMYGIALYGVSVGLNNIALSLFALQTLRFSPAEYGVVAAMFPCGNLIAVVSAPPLVKNVGTTRLYAVTLCLLGVVYCAYALNSSFVLAIILMALAGAVFACYLMCQGPILLASTPVGFMGRVTAITGPLLSLSSLAASVVAAQIIRQLLEERLVFTHGEPFDPYRLCLLVSAVLLVGGGGVLIMAARRRETVVPVRG